MRHALGAVLSLGRGQTPGPPKAADHPLSGTHLLEGEDTPIYQIQIHGSLTPPNRGIKGLVIKSKTEKIWVKIRYRNYQSQD